ncbi:GyrI-like domain-containing protein [Allomuricauda sp. SCSIO 65647]|uniref:GyrI-like domain-containing protein n=1 Tax=Allomuricauda sp. SCSIO 65647 TaxID=2908843 RepID=UPI001F429A1D|nr:GyrI-like domain-containing protein [Muricauda sp. SCSIO 65647]UJH66234.1 AraC family transcriptional regulator [Muricauda sp. SCSIO 65647]
MKKIVYGALVLIFAALVWYLFIKPSDYTIRFTANTFPGAINQTLKLWDKDLDTVVKLKQDGDLYHLEQKIRFGDSIHRYRWSIKPINDSTSKVVVNIKDENHSLANKLNVPFSDTDFEKRGRATVRDFMETLQEHKEKFKVKVVGEDEMPTKYVAYIPLKATQPKKAGRMMKNFSYLMGELMDRGVKFDGFPLVEVTKWNQDNDSIHFNFGRPIIRSEKLPMGTDIQYKRIFKKKALKAEYYGNYITSDRAWYALLDYAEKNDIPIEPTPIEVFHNNPSSDGNELKWKAEIYLPIKEDVK